MDDIHGAINMPHHGNQDQPYYSGAFPMGRNKEITDDFTMLNQAREAIEGSRKSATGKMNEADYGGEKVTTDPGLSV